MSDVTTRPALPSDLPRLAEIYNHYIVNTPITFNTQPFTVETFEPWFEEHSDGKRHRLVVAVENGDEWPRNRVRWNRAVPPEGSLRNDGGDDDLLQSRVHATRSGDAALSRLIRIDRGRGYQSRRGRSHAAESGVGRAARALRVSACGHIYGQWAQVREVLGCGVVRTATSGISFRGKSPVTLDLLSELKLRPPKSCGDDLGYNGPLANRSRGNNGSFFRDLHQLFSAGMDHHRAAGGMDRGRSQPGSRFRVPGEPGDRNGGVDSGRLDFFEAGHLGAADSYTAWRPRRWEPWCWC